MTRWQQFYLEDPHLGSIRPSACAGWATVRFRAHGKHTILDLACGAGRDTVALAQSGLAVVGVDAARSGLGLARSRQGAGHTFHLIEADARRLPFAGASFEGVYCFGLLHEFVGETAGDDVRLVMDEAQRVLQPGGLLVLAVLAGEPEQGLPHVRLFSEPMLDEATRSFRCVEKQVCDDLGCTGRPDYHVWYGVYSARQGLTPPPA